MSLHYLIDGYNLLYALDAIPPGTWPEKRSAVLRFLKTHRLQGKNKMTVVFDNQEGGGSRQGEADFTVVYTAGESADEWLSAEVRRSSNPRILVVVSNDQGIRLLVRGTGARFATIDEFLKPLRKSLRKPSLSERPVDDSITEEFKKKWL
jgi:predicted RNA-binding protein with PIN domain